MQAIASMQAFCAHGWRGEALLWLHVRAILLARSPRRGRAVLRRFAMLRYVSDFWKRQASFVFSNQIDSSEARFRAAKKRIEYTISPASRMMPAVRISR